MYYRDHPPPHFHAIYGEFEATVGIATGTLIDGEIPPRAMTLVREWTKLHRNELDENWQLARTGQALRQLDPLQ
jgi:hypothetical protein